MKYIIGPDNPPPCGNGVAYWERAKDPFHADAFANTPAAGVIKSEGARVEMWLGIDFWENPIMTAYDGTALDEAPANEFVFHNNSYGHRSAFPLPLDDEIAKRHGITP